MPSEDIVRCVNFSKTNAFFTACSSYCSLVAAIYSQVVNFRNVVNFSSTTGMIIGQWIMKTSYAVSRQTISSVIHVCYLPVPYHPNPVSHTAIQELHTIFSMHHSDIHSVEILQLPVTAQSKCVSTLELVKGIQIAG